MAAVSRTPYMYPSPNAQADALAQQRLAQLRLQQESARLAYVQLYQQYLQTTAMLYNSGQNPYYGYAPQPGAVYPMQNYAVMPGPTVVTQDDYAPQPAAEEAAFVSAPEPVREAVSVGAEPEFSETPAVAEKPAEPEPLPESVSAEPVAEAKPAPEPEADLPVTEVPAEEKTVSVEPENVEEAPKSEAVSEVLEPVAEEEKPLTEEVAESVPPAESADASDGNGESAIPEAPAEPEGTEASEEKTEAENVPANEETSVERELAATEPESVETTEDDKAPEGVDTPAEISPDAESESEVLPDSEPEPVSVPDLGPYAMLKSCFSAYKTMWKNGVKFSGKASTDEFWKATGVNFTLAGMLWLLSSSALRLSAVLTDLSKDIGRFGYNTSEMLGTVASYLNWGILGADALLAAGCVLSFFPMAAMTVRRLRDAGKSSGAIFLSLIPVVGWIWLCVLLCRKEPDALSEEA